MIYDIHSHHSVPYPQGVVSVQPARDFEPAAEQLYSVGLHPRHSVDDDAEAVIDIVQRLSANRQVVAIGECGVDLTKGAPLFKQLSLFRRQVEISEVAGKPVIIHAVKSPDIIIGVHKELAATRPWAIHGFRGKPTVAAMYLRAGLWLSFGEKYNPESLLAASRNHILAETDESELTIEQIMALHAATLGMAAEDYKALIAANTARFLNLQ